jgi:hypothetical protein
VAVCAQPSPTRWLAFVAGCREPQDLRWCAHRGGVGPGSPTATPKNPPD